MNRPLTPDAADTLALNGFTRRDFLKTTGVLLVTFAMGEVTFFSEDADAQGINGPGAPSLDAWIAIAGDGSVTAYTGKCELGQGLFTAQVQLIAEELCVPIGRVHLIQCDTSVTPDQGTTSGAQSHPANFNNANLGQAGATAREALIQLGSERLSVPIDQLMARDGAIVATADPAKRVTYGELIGGKRFSMTISRTAKRRPPKEWTVLGTLGAPRRPAGPGDGNRDLRPQRARPRHAARARRASACGWRDARERGREFDQGCRRRGEARRPQELRGHRRREAVPGDPRRAGAEGHLDRRHRPAEPGGVLRSDAAAEAGARHAARQFR